MFGQMKIKTRILGILAVLAGGYLLLLAMVQFSVHCHAQPDVADLLLAVSRRAARCRRRRRPSSG